MRSTRELMQQHDVSRKTHSVAARRGARCAEQSANPSRAIACALLPWKVNMIGNKPLENNPLWVVDVGASGGIDARWSKFTDSYRGILFEPDPREYERLRTNSGKQFIVLNSALSDRVSTIDFHLCDKQRASSVFLPNLDFLRRFPNLERFNISRVVQIETDTLDNQLKKNSIAEVDFIKIDTQGYELPILRGSLDCLVSVTGMELEVEFAPLYIDQPMFNDVDKFVREQGFELFDIKKSHWKREGGQNRGDHKGQLVFGDALYFRSPESVALIKNITQKKIIRAICVYLVYGYSDLARVLLNLTGDEGMLAHDVRDRVEIMISKAERGSMLSSIVGKGGVRGLLEKLSKRVNHGW